MAQAEADGPWAKQPPPDKSDPLDQKSYRRAASCPLGPDAGLRTALGSSLGNTNRATTDLARAFSFEVSSLKSAATAAVAEVTGMTQLSFAALAGPDRRSTRSEALTDLTADTAQLSLQDPPPPDSVPPARTGSSRKAPSTHEAPEKSSQSQPEQTPSPEADNEEPDSPNRQHAEQSAMARSQRCPPHGIKAICGRRPRMEDAYSAIPFLLEVPVPRQRNQLELVPERIAPDLASAPPQASDSDAARRHSSLGSSTSSLEPWHPYLETLHFFGVFDGHGGADAALYCAQTLHQRIVEAVNATTPPAASRSIGNVSPRAEDENTDPAAAEKQISKAADAQPEEDTSLQEQLSSAQADDVPFQFTDASAAGIPEASSDSTAAASDTTVSSAPGISPFALDTAVRSPSSSTEGRSSEEAPRIKERASLTQPLSSQESEALIRAGLADHAHVVQQQQQGESEQVETLRDGAACTPQGFEAALASAFNRVDEEFGQGESAALMGTTVVVALVGSRQLYVANCGDSRAVLCRGNVAIPLTEDHKAARDDEQARIEALGGQILYWNGVRVMGVLAVSRAVGDHCLRPFVIPKPEVTIVARRPDDELLLLASDGLWDVLSNQEAVTLAKRCLRRARQRGASRQSAARIAATVLTRAAFDRGSRDNVTVVVIDLGLGGQDQDTGDDQDTNTKPLPRNMGSDAGDFDKAPSHRLSEAARMSDPDS